MKKRIIETFNIIKNNKRAKTLIIIVTVSLFMFTLGYSLSYFDGTTTKKVTNIEVNGLAFNITTNSGASDDRILHLQAGKLERFDITLTNLNKVDVKYEITYELCNDSNCTTTSNSIPSSIEVGKLDEETEINGTIVGYNKFKEIAILTTNNSETDYYIKLTLNAGYSWNDLELANQIDSVKSYVDNNVDVLAYVDGVAVNTMPTSCAYTSDVKIYNSTGELTADKLDLICNYYTSKWSFDFKELSAIPTRIVLNFVKQDIPEDMLVKNYAYTSDASNIYTVPTDGYFNLEVWGSQGKQDVAYQGFGGYSQGIAYLTKGTKLYIYVGSQGAYPNAGKGYGSCGNNGGGSTHIALEDKKIADYGNTTTAKSKVIIVAGGGGGQLYNCSSTSGLCTGTECKGGNAGGMQGNKGVYILDGSSQGGGQTASGNTKFGIAADTGWDSGGNGGGWYGGANGRFSAGGGGSGFIDSTILASVNKRAMYCYSCTQNTAEATFTINTLGTSDYVDKTNCPSGYSKDPVSKCAKAGNGHARITFINSTKI